MRTPRIIIIALVSLLSLFLATPVATAQTSSSGDATAAFCSVSVSIEEGGSFLFVRAWYSENSADCPGAGGTQIGAVIQGVWPWSAAYGYNSCSGNYCSVRGDQPQRMVTASVGYCVQADAFAYQPDSANVGRTGTSRGCTDLPSWIQSCAKSVVQCVTEITGMITASGPSPDSVDLPVGLPETVHMAVR